MIQTGFKNKKISLALPAEIISSPALLYLYHRVEQILGIKAETDALIKLNEYLEKEIEGTFVDNPASYEYLLTSNEYIYKIAQYITINETYFFREGIHFETLIGFFPEFAKLGRPVEICSAAVSTGCEAYSIAMLFDYYSNKGYNLDYNIDAFDVSAFTIETAKNGFYSENTLRGDGSDWRHILDIYLNPCYDGYTVTENIREKVTFFTHNVMDKLEKKYDVIFFRNSLIYFSANNRHKVINNLYESLNSNGILFPGVSETASVDHPFLDSRCMNNTFYFQKKPALNSTIQSDCRKKNTHIKKDLEKEIIVPVKTDDNSVHVFRQRNQELPVICAEIAEILKTGDGEANAQNVLDLLNNKDIESLSGSSFAASVLYFLSIQDFNSANFILDLLEKYNSGVFTRFLRGEYYFLQGDAEKAEKNYQDASVKDKYFWPAFYRIASLSENTHVTRFEYKIKKAIESIDLSHKINNYECFMGGFSPDYFRRILDRKLEEKREVSNE